MVTEFICVALLYTRVMGLRGSHSEEERARESSSEPNMYEDPVERKDDHAGDRTGPSLLMGDALPLS